MLVAEILSQDQNLGDDPHIIMLLPFFLQVGPLRVQSCMDVTVIKVIVNSLPFTIWAATRLWGFRQGEIQTSLLSYRD